MLVQMQMYRNASSANSNKPATGALHDVAHRRYHDALYFPNVIRIYVHVWT